MYAHLRIVTSVSRRVLCGSMMTRPWKTPAFRPVGLGRRLVALPMVVANLCYTIGSSSVCARQEAHCDGRSNLVQSFNLSPSSSFSKVFCQPGCLLVDTVHVISHSVFY